jgi:hypothetical protein
VRSPAGYLFSEVSTSNRPAAFPIRKAGLKKPAHMSNFLTQRTVSVLSQSFSCFLHPANCLDPPREDEGRSTRGPSLMPIGLPTEIICKCLVQHSRRMRLIHSCMVLKTLTAHITHQSLEVLDLHHRAAAESV